MAKSSNGESKPTKTTSRRRVAKAPTPSPTAIPSIASVPATASDSPRNAAPEGFPNLADVRRRAYELYLQRGGGHGRDLDDWYEAERQLGGQRKSLPRA
jgi:hypothetical protein